MLDVLTLSPFITYPNVYFTCRRMYALWPATRDTVVNHMILSHTLPERKSCVFDLVLNYGSGHYGTCSKRSRGNVCRRPCRSKACDVYRMYDSTTFDRHVTYCYKTDIINGITFRLMACTDVPGMIRRLNERIITYGLSICVGRYIADLQYACDRDDWWHKALDVSKLDVVPGSALSVRIMDYIGPAAVDSVAFLGADLRDYIQ